MADDDRSPADPEPPLTILGSTVRHPVDHVEWFPAPPHCAAVRFTSEEVASICPVTGQPDLSTVVVDYAPHQRCVESKSLKLFLWSFRDRPIFAEALAGVIAEEVADTAQPRWVRVTLTQRPRGGVELRAVAVIGDGAPAPPLTPPADG